MSSKLWIKLYDADAIDKAGVRDFLFALYNGVTEQTAHDRRYYVFFAGELLNIPGHTMIKDPNLLGDRREGILAKCSVDDWILAKITPPGYSDDESTPSPISQFVGQGSSRVDGGPISQFVGQGSSRIGPSPHQKTDL